MLQPLHDPLKRFFDQIVTEADYIVFQEAGRVFAKNGRTGQIEYSGNASEVIQSVLNMGKVTFIKPGLYFLEKTLSIPSGATLVGAQLGTILVSNASPVVDISSKMNVHLRDLIIRGTTTPGNATNQVGIALREVSWIYIENVVVDYVDYGIYINSELGNTVELRNIGIFNSNNGFTINGANQIYIYNPHIALPSPRTGKSAFVFRSLLGDSRDQAQNIKIYGGHVINVEYCFRWMETIEGLRIGVFGTSFESFDVLVSVEADQYGNLFMDFYSILVFSNGITRRILSGKNLTMHSLRANFHDASWIGPVASDFVFCDQPVWYISYDILGAHKFATGFPTIRTRNRGTATIPAGSTYVDVPHGLSIAPDVSRIRVTPLTNLGGRSFWVSDVTSTTFRINISSADTVDHSFAWSYE